MLWTNEYSFLWMEMILKVGETFSNTEYEPRFTTKTFKRGGSNIMVYGCISYRGVGSIHRIEGIMDQHT